MRAKIVNPFFSSRPGLFVCFQLIPIRSIYILFWKRRQEAEPFILKSWQRWSILTSSRSTKWKRISVRSCAFLLLLLLLTRYDAPQGQTLILLWRLQGPLFYLGFLFFPPSFWFLIRTEVSFVRGIPMATTTTTVPSISTTTAGGPSSQPGRPGFNQHT